MGLSEVKNIVYLLLDMELLVRAQQCYLFASEQGPAHIAVNVGSSGTKCTFCLHSFMKHQPV